MTMRITTKKSVTVHSEHGWIVVQEIMGQPQCFAYGSWEGKALGAFENRAAFDAMVEAGAAELKAEPAD